MSDSRTRVHSLGQPAFDSKTFQSAVSLHSHTMYSKEYLGRLPRYICQVPIGGFILEREIGRAHLRDGTTFDFKKSFWTPPLSPREAYELESGQIEKSLGLTPLVSLTDHDNIDAGCSLRMLPGLGNAPISVEWSVPFEDTVFHLGVHNLPAAEAREWMNAFSAYTANPKPEELTTLLHEVHAQSQVLVVLNHPYWDADSLVPRAHQARLDGFLAQYRSVIHAIELNGMRSRRENKDVLTLGSETGIPVVAGGDRHGCEPNAVLNVSQARSFEEFAWEVRELRSSEIVLMPQYFEPLQLRLLENAWHALADAPGEFGRRHWMSRVFYIENGKEKPLSCFTGTRFHRLVDKCRWIMSLLVSPALRPALRLPFLGSEEGGI